jgi:hypothetical protein
VGLEPSGVNRELYKFLLVTSKFILASKSVCVEGEVNVVVWHLQQSVVWIPIVE